MDNVIILKFDKTLTGLAGYDFGTETFEEQVEGKIDYMRKIEIVFPDNIERIASSFIQGFFEKFIEKIGVSGIEQQIDIKSSKKDMKETIIKNLM